MQLKGCSAFSKTAIKLNSCLYHKNYLNTVQIHDLGFILTLSLLYHAALIESALPDSYNPAVKMLVCIVLET